MRLIDADVLPLDNIDDANYGSNYIRIAPTVNAIPIPENATNGDMIKAMFPNFKITDLKNKMIKVDISESYDEYFEKTWWNSPYKRESENKK